MLRGLSSLRPSFSLRCFSASNYLFESKGTHSLQESLPRLPIPILEDSCRRYLDAQRPILNDSEFEQTQKLVNDFKQGVGPSLQHALVDYDKALDQRFSYVHEAWSEMYFTDRLSILINQIPGLTFQDEIDPARRSQVERATSLVSSLLRYHVALRDEKLPPLKNCTLAYPYLFQTSRIPRPNADVLTRNPESRHIVVVSKGRLYSVEVLDGVGAIRSSLAIRQALQQILDDKRPPEDLGLGYFTALDRDSWVEPRKELDATNGGLMKTVDEALFVVCLDDADASTEKEVIFNGLIGNPCNRWYDKCFEVMITKNGKINIHWEHSWGDGAIIIQMMNAVYDDMKRYEPVLGSDEHITAVKLDPVLTETSKSQLAAARTVVNKTIGKMDLIPFQFHGFGKNTCKKFGVSPDSISQLIFQVAQWRHRANAVGTYESCSTSAFRSGRTETIRSCSKETKSCSLAMDHDHPASLEEIVSLLKKNSEKHVTLCKDAAQGQGFDRHLFALRWINKKQGLPDLPLFSHPNHSKLSTIRLSTSTVAAPCLQLCLAFGPVSDDGLGLGYLMDQESFLTAVTSFPPASSSSDFVRHLQSTCDDLHAVFTGKNFKPARSA